MKSNYMVLVNGRVFQHIIYCRKLKTAEFIMNMRIWTYAKIHDVRTKLCVEINDRRDLA